MNCLGNGGVSHIDDHKQDILLRNNLHQLVVHDGGNTLDLLIVPEKCKSFIQNQNRIAVFY